MKKNKYNSSTSSGAFTYRRSSEPHHNYQEPWKATKKSFDSFDKDNYWYTGNVRADIVVS